MKKHNLQEKQENVQCYLGFLSGDRSFLIQNFFFTCYFCKFGPKRLFCTNLQEKLRKHKKEGILRFISDRKFIFVGLHSFCV